MTTLLEPTPATPPAPTPAPAPDVADASGQALLRELGAPVGPRSPGVIGGLVTSVATFGLLPALLWPLRFARFADRQRHDLMQLAKWVSQTSPHPSTKRLSSAAAGMEFKTILALIALACCGAIAVVYVGLLPTTRGAGQAWDMLLGSTFGGIYASSPHGRSTLFLVWSAGLTVAYLCQWLQVQLHAYSVRKFLDPLNEVMIDEGLAPVFLVPVGFGLGPLWVAAGAVLVLLGAPWGVCLMLAGGVQSRYTRRVTPRLRAQLAQRVRDLQLLRRPSPARQSTADPEIPRGYTRTKCQTPGCRMPLPAAARFCPRCGAQSAGPMDRVA